MSPQYGLNCTGIYPRAHFLKESCDNTSQVILNTIVTVDYIWLSHEPKTQYIMIT